MATKIGVPQARVEDDRLLRGKGRFTDDIHLVGTVHAHFIRSTHANARIKAIDVSAARELQGVHLVLTGHDLGRLNDPLPLLAPHPSLTNPRTQLPLAVERVRYVGEAIVMIVADTRYKAEDAAALVVVDYEPFPAVVELATAVDCPAHVHDDIADNIAAVLSQITGDPDAAFASAPHTITLDLAIERSCGMPMEGRAILADWDPRRETLSVWDSTQSHVAIRQGLSRILDVPLDRLEVTAPDVGGGFGTKIMLFYPEEVLVPIAAMRLGRPVSWTEDRWEHFISANQERGQDITARIAFDDDGKILAVESSFLHDTGAYTPYGIAVPAVTGTHTLGQYNIKNYRTTGTVVYTNKPPVSPYRGAGRPQGVYAMERLISAMATELGWEPSAVRQANLLDDDVFPYDTGLQLQDGSQVIYDSGQYRAGFDLLLKHTELAEFRERQATARSEGRHLGIGMATYVEGSGVGPYEGCTITLNATGTVVVEVSVPSQGQSHATVFSQVAAEYVGCRVTDVSVTTTSGGPHAVGHGTFGSRAAIMSGNAVAAAGGVLRGKILDAAAHVLGVEKKSLSIADGVISSKASGAPELTLAQLATAVNPITYPGSDNAHGWHTATSQPPVTLTATEFHRSSQWVFGSGAHSAEVEIDPGTGRITVNRYVVIHDCGKVLNPKVVDGQIIGGLLQGIGGALLERLTFDESGQPTTTSFLNFRMPTIDDLPPLILDEIQTPSPWNPLGIKGTGEAGIIPVVAAIAEAIEDALRPFDFTLTQMPMFPADVRAVITAHQTKEPN